MVVKLRNVFGNDKIRKMMFCGERNKNRNKDYDYLHRGIE